MSHNPFSILCNRLIILVIGVLLSTSQAVAEDGQVSSLATTNTACRFGITSVLGSEGYDIAGLGVGSYLDWGAVTNPDLPDGVEYIRVLRVRNDLYQQTLDNLPTWVQGNPGSIWVVGNEPDTTYEGQDGILPEDYAERYYQLATIIRSMDPSARIGFGSVVQPTPIRIRYLNRAWNQLVDDAGSPAVASGLIDIWSIHSFILNEQVGYWGTGIPPGFEDDHEDAVIITDLTDTYSIAIYQERIINFRNWMASMGEREKPLWITEYGSLLPPIDPPEGPDYANVSDQDSANFMLATFDFMLSAIDGQIGLPTDNDHLVQRWFWYSLNDYRYHFGGTIFDPENGNLPTIVGEAFMGYQPLSLAQPDLFPISLLVAPVSYNFDRTLVNYRLDLRIGNALLADTSSSAQAWIYDGDPDAGGTLIAGPILSDAIQRCGGTQVVSATWMGVQPLTQHTLYVQVDPVGVADTNPDNNQASFNVFLELPRLHFLPVINR